MGMLGLVQCISRGNTTVEWELVGFIFVYKLTGKGGY